MDSGWVIQGPVATQVLPAAAKPWQVPQALRALQAQEQNQDQARIPLARLVGPGAPEDRVHFARAEYRCQTAASNYPNWFPADHAHQRAAPIAPSWGAEDPASAG